MKLQELKLDEWDGSYEEVYHSNNEKILLLHLTNLLGLKEQGRRNLIKTDNHYNIIWIAEAPEIGRSIGWFKEGLKVDKTKLVGWYGGSVYVEIDIFTGSLLEEKFIPW